MKSFWNFIRNNWLYAFINIFGLTASLTFVILLAVYVNRQLTTDAFQKNADRIYVYANENFIGSAYYLQKHLTENFPEIEKATSLFSMNAIGSLSIGDGQRVLTHKTTYADSSFFDIFSFNLIEGSVQAWKASDRSAVISRTFADTYFPGRDPVGQSLRYTSPEGDVYIFTVAAVMEDIGHSVIPYCDVLCRAEVLTEVNSANNENMDNSGGFETFIMTWPGADIQARIPDIREYFGKTWWIYTWNMVDKVFFVPLRDIYFYDEAESLAGNILQGDRRLVDILLAACIILLLFAVLNYINLTVAQSGRRAKEMATRRLLGSSRQGIISRMILEATIFAAASTILAIMIAEALSPYASRLLEYDFSVWKEINTVFALLVITGVAIIGLLSGIAPAMVISRAKPIDIVRGSFNLRMRSWYGKILIVLQQVVSVAMIAVALTMFFQIRAMLNAPLGYNTKDILNISSGIFISSDQVRAFRDAVERLPMVEAAGFGDGIPLGGTNNNTMSYHDRIISFQIIQGDAGYFDILGLKVKQDNHLDDKDAFFWNEYAFKETGLPESSSEAIFSHAYGTYHMQIGGVYYDFKINSLLSEQHPGLIRRYDVYPADRTPWNIIIRISGDHAEAYEKIAQVYDSINPGGPFEASFIEDQIADTFAEYIQLKKIIIIFTVISVFVSSLGLFAMSTYYIRARSRKIAVQKVFGASKRLVMGQTVSSYVILSVIAFVISVPVSRILTATWMTQFTYRIDTGFQWMLIFTSGVLACIIALATVLYQCIKAVDASPVTPLRRDD